jgi:ABC-type glutathione transport system ATPase component
MASNKQDSVYKFKNIGFSVEAKDDNGDKVEKQILQNISATVKSGHVLAIMGPSGAGKTSLINVSASPGNPCICRMKYSSHSHSLNSSLAPTAGTDHDGLRRQIYGRSDVEREAIDRGIV